MRNGIPPLLSNRKRYKGSKERLVLFFPHNGTSAALPPHQSKFLRVGARGEGAFFKKRPPPIYSLHLKRDFIQLLDSGVIGIDKCVDIIAELY